MKVRMTANNKTDELLKEDGSTEVLIIGDVHQKTKQRSASKNRRKLQLAAIILLLFLCCGGVVFTVMIVKYKNQGFHLSNMHHLKYQLNGMVKTCGTQMKPFQNTEVVEMDDTVSITDGAMGISVVKVAGEEGPLCIIRNDYESPTFGHFTLPSKEVLDKNIFNKSKSLGPMPVIMSDKLWLVDYEIQPKPASELIAEVCGPDAVYYRTKEVSDADYSGDFYTNYGEGDDEDIFDELMERERRDVSESDEEGDEDRPLPNTNNLEEESDHDRNCCNACTGWSLFCTRICFEPEHHMYTSGYRTCYDGCFVMMPCSWWGLRANGQV